MSKAVINIFGYIGPGDGFFTEDGVTLASVQAQIDQVAEDQDTITVRISSYGGSVDEGEAIYSALKNSGKKVEVEIIGQAYSIASVIAMAADPGSLRIAENGKVMIHQAWTFSSGNADQLEDVIEELREIDERIFSYYMKRPNAKANENTLREYFAEEKILNADKAIELGLADSLIGVVAEAKFYPFRAMNTLPKELQNFNNKSNMKKLEDVIRDGFKNLGKQLNALRGVKDAAIETDKGPLYYEGDTIEAGVTAVFSDEAMTVAAEDGTYTYDGNEYTVAGGIVVGIPCWCVVGKGGSVGIRRRRRATAVMAVGKLDRGYGLIAGVGNRVGVGDDLAHRDVDRVAGGLCYRQRRVSGGHGERVILDLAISGRSAGSQARRRGPPEPGKGLRGDCRWRHRYRKFDRPVDGSVIVTGAAILDICSDLLTGSAKGIIPIPVDPGL